MNEALIRSFSLAGRAAVITGAASGIGRETAQVLAQAGANVVIADIDATGLGATAALVESAGGRVLIVRADVAQRSDVDALADKAVRAMGCVDIWVNAAGVLIDVPVLQAAEAEVERLLAINLKGVYWGCAAAGRVMQQPGRGCIVNVSSGGGESAVPGLSIYSMTKAAVNMLTKTVAKEFGAFGVRANAVAPGFVETPMVEIRYRDENGEINTGLREQVLRQRAQSSPMGLTGTPRDIALAILYLASDASRFVTGQILRPNGGVAMP